MNYTNQLVEKGYSNLIIEKGHGDLIVENDSKSKVVQLKKEASECDANLLEVISNKFEEMSKVQQEAIESLKQEVADLESKLENKLDEMFKKAFNDFTTKVNEGA